MYNLKYTSDALFISRLVFDWTTPFYIIFLSLFYLCEMAKKTESSKNTHTHTGSIQSRCDVHIVYVLLFVLAPQYPPIVYLTIFSVTLKNLPNECLRHNSTYNLMTGVVSIHNVWTLNHIMGATRATNNQK